MPSGGLVPGGSSFAAQTGATTPLLQNELQGKAKSDGEDVLTPLLQQTANTVLTQVNTKK